MVGNIADLSGARIRGIPQVDTSWLGSLISSVEQAGQDINQARSFNGLADRIQGTTPAQQTAGGFLSGLMGKVTGNAPMPLPGAAREIAATSPKVAASGSGNVYDDFIGGVKSAGLTNPYGLAAVAATGQAESGWSPQNANRSWSDPSQSGQAGTAGGVMSWRNERLNNLYNFARQRGEEPGNISPTTQAAFFVQEDPKLIQALNSAQSPEEAQRLMNNAWKFAGYDQPGGETARRMGLASSYVSRFQGAPTEVASLDPSAGMPSTAAPAAQAIEAAAPASGYVDPMVKVEPRADAAPYTMASATAPQPQRQAAPQAASAQAPSAGMIAQGVTPVQRGSVDPSLIQYMLRDRNLRDVGLKLWAANVEGQKASEPWQFVTLPDGTLARANQQSGAVERLGNFAKPNEDAIVVGDNLVRRSNGEVVYEGKPKTPASYQEYKLAQQDGFKGSYADWEKVKVPGVTVNNGNNSSKFAEKSDEEAAKRLNTIVDGGNAAPQMVEDLQTLATLGAQIGTGRQAQVMATIGPWAQALGIDIKSMGEIAAFQAITARLIPQMRPPGSGPQTDADARNLLNSIPTIGKTAEGNRIIVETMQKIQENKIAAAEIASRAYLPKEEGGITWQEAEKQIRELGNPYEAFKQYTKAQSGNNPPAAPTPPAPPQPGVVRSQIDYDRLPSGTQYTDPNGNIRTKR